jgi:hypothetical protein
MPFRCVLVEVSNSGPRRFRPTSTCKQSALKDCDTSHEDGQNSECHRKSKRWLVEIGFTISCQVSKKRPFLGLLALLLLPPELAQPALGCVVHTRARLVCHSCGENLSPNRNNSVLC